MGEQPTIFDRIIRGEIPSYKVYEDDHVFAFLDISPLSKGHTLVVPKESKAYLHDLSDESAAAIGRALPRLCRAVMKATGATAYNVLQNNELHGGVPRPLPHHPEVQEARIGWYPSSWKPRRENRRGNSRRVGRSFEIVRTVHRTAHSIIDVANTWFGRPSARQILHERGSLRR
jgi:diadenosine tetraphosphate (Ap4A) HIT family hydrolase